MRVQDVTPEYIKALQSAGFKVGIDDIIGAKVQDVTPEFIERGQAAWLQRSDPAETDSAAATGNSGFQG